MKMIKLAVLTALLASAATAQTSHHQQKTPDWNFAVSGDSRNCGDVVMPSIAAGAIKNNAAFYWHLGDLRAIYGIDQDYQNSPEHRGKTIQKDEYLKDAWDDFIQNQLGAFGSMPVFVGIGNHETTPPKTREQFAAKFAQWLDSATLKTQRLADDPQATAPNHLLSLDPGRRRFYLSGQRHTRPVLARAGDLVGRGVGARFCKS